MAMPQFNATGLDTSARTFNAPADQNQGRQIATRRTLADRLMGIEDAGAVADYREDDDYSRIDAEPPPQTKSDEELLKLAQEAQSQAATFMSTAVRRRWAQSYRAYRNEHPDGSKYETDQFRGRSKFFRPKTRSAVKRKMANAAQALFGNGDIITCAAQNEADEGQAAAAALKQELIKYRLSRTTRRNGIKWFLITAGAVQTAQITSVVVSKQTWRYREDSSVSSRDGRPAVIEDRPCVDLIPPENVLIDPNADWTNPSQLSQYLILRYAMTAEDVMSMIRQNVSTGDIEFYPITEELIRTHVQGVAPYDTTSSRVAREGGRDPKLMVAGTFGQIWVNEVYMRVDDLDVCFWTLNNSIMLSKPKPVRQAYPAMGGERPVIIGYGEIEAFRPFPMSLVESLAGMQGETNDQVNLRLDHMKQVVAPPAKVARGKNVDLKAVQRRGPDNIILVNSQDDVEWFQQPDVPNSAYQENNLLTADMDTLAGTFDGGSVANNRNLNETVGGMKLLAASTNPLSDFDLAVFVETWAEPVLWQVMKLEEFYESDAVVLAIAGERAKLFQKFGVNAITDEMLSRESTLTISIGSGSANMPEEKQRKFANAMMIAMQTMQPFVQAGVIQPPVPKVKQIINTVFTLGGFTDGGERFFGGMDDSGQPQPPQPPPAPPPDPAAMQANEIKAKQVETDAALKSKEIDQKAAVEEARLQLEQQRLELERQKLALEQQFKALELQQRQAEADASREAEHNRGVNDLFKMRMQHQHDARTQKDSRRGAMHMARQKSLDQERIAKGKKLKGVPIEEEPEEEKPPAPPPKPRKVTVQRGPDGKISGYEIGE